MRVIDATEGGAKIEGAENMKMSEVVAGGVPAEFDSGRLNRRYRRPFSVGGTAKTGKSLQKIETSGRGFAEIYRKTDSSVRQSMPKIWRRYRGNG